MANKPRRMCTTPGCPNFAVRFGVCAQCLAKRERQRGSAASRGYDARWRKLRKAFLQANPWCVRCGAPATDVDHIIPRSAGGTDDWSNLQALCHACHSAKTAAQTPR
jgi:5-methylcytosine-specific restriction enzyme A